MSGMKNFLENVSVMYGFDGEINDEVIELGKEVLNNIIDDIDEDIEFKYDPES